MNQISLDPWLPPSVREKPRIIRDPNIFPPGKITIREGINNGWLKKGSRFYKNGLIHIRYIRGEYLKSRSSWAKIYRSPKINARFFDIKWGYSCYRVYPKIETSFLAEIDINYIPHPISLEETIKGILETRLFKHRRRFISNLINFPFESQIYEILLEHLESDKSKELRRYIYFLLKYLINKNENAPEIVLNYILQILNEFPTIEYTYFFKTIQILNEIYFPPEIIPEPLLDYCSGMRAESINQWQRDIYRNFLQKVSLNGDIVE